MRPDADPATLAPVERLEEIAAILADGLRRLRDTMSYPSSPFRETLQNPATRTLKLFAPARSLTTSVDDSEIPRGRSGCH